MNEYYLYTHRNPVTLEIFYVGIGKENRAYQFNTKRRNELWNRYVKKNGIPIVDIFYKNSKRSDVAEIETLIISVLGKKMNKSGQLVNITNGGERGSFGYKPTEQTLLKLSISHIGLPSGMKGKRQSDSAKEKISKAGKGRESWNKGKKASESTKIKMSVSRKGREPWNKGKEWNLETKIKMSKAKIGMYTKKVKMYNKDGVFIKMYNSIKEAGEENNISKTSISMVCNGARKTAGGYKFKFES